MSRRAPRLYVLMILSMNERLTFMENYLLVFFASFNRVINNAREIKVAEALDDLLLISELSRSLIKRPKLRATACRWSRKMFTSTVWLHLTAWLCKTIKSKITSKLLIIFYPLIKLKLDSCDKHFSKRRRRNVFARQFWNSFQHFESRQI